MIAVPGYGKGRPLGRLGLWVLAVVAAAAGAAGAQLLFDSVEAEYDNYARLGYPPLQFGGFRAHDPQRLRRSGQFCHGRHRGFSVGRGPHQRAVAGQPCPQGAALRPVPESPACGPRQLRRLVEPADRGRTGCGTKFTSLTLGHGLRSTGLRWDIDTGNNKLTFVTSRTGLADLQRRSITTSIAPGTGRPIFWPATSSAASGSWTCTFPMSTSIGPTAWWIGGKTASRDVLPRTNNPPAYIVVKFADGSQLDGNGPRVFDVRIRGELEEIRPLVTRHDSGQIDPTFPNRDEFFPEGKTIPPYIEFLRGQLPTQGSGTGANLSKRAGANFCCIGLRYPSKRADELDRLGFEALVANDYLIEVAEVFLPIASTSTANPDVSGERASFFYPVAAAPGNVKDGSNKRWVRFEYGRQTGRTNLSMRIEIVRRGFSLRSEVARTYEFRQYPTARGGRRWGGALGRCPVCGGPKRMGAPGFERRGFPDVAPLQHHPVGAGRGAALVHRLPPEPVFGIPQLCRPLQQYPGPCHRRRQR